MKRTFSSVSARATGSALLLSIAVVLVLFAVGKNTARSGPAISVLPASGILFSHNTIVDFSATSGEPFINSAPVDVPPNTLAGSPFISVPVGLNTVPGALQNPTLDLHDGNGTLLRSNDNWPDAPNAAEILAAGLAPPDPNESAILMTLGPGNYTSIVRGVNRTTGIALAEAYKLNN